MLTNFLKYNNMKMILLLFCILGLTVTIMAQPPQAFNYQGIARDGSGAPLINKNITLRIAILQGALPGIEVYKENHNVSTNRLGIFNIEVGHGTLQLGLFDQIDWGAGDHYIQTEMDPAGGTNFALLGEAQLLSVPYALYAGNGPGSSEIWKTNADGIHYTDGHIGIGTSNPSNVLTIDGDVPSGEERFFISVNNSSLSNRSFAAAKFTAGTGTSMTTFGHNSETYDSDNFITADFGGIFSSGAGIHLTAGGENGVIKFLTGKSNTGGSIEHMIISSDGNLGIGAKNPVSRLQVADGDVFIENINNGVIMKSPNGNCWRLTVNDNGSVKTTAITCPD